MGGGLRGCSHVYVSGLELQVKRLGVRPGFSVVYEWYIHNRIISYLVQTIIRIGVGLYIYIYYTYE